MDRIPILFLDDNELSHNFIEALIEVERLPIHPIFETHPLQILEVLSYMKEEEFPLAIISDINMPRMNGFEFFESFISSFPERSLSTGLFITSNGIQVDEYKRVIESPHIDAYLPKPLTLKIFREDIFPILSEIKPFVKF